MPDSATGALRLLRRLAPPVVIAQAAAAVVLLLTWAGLLQPLEMLLFDQTLRLVVEADGRAGRAPPPVVLVQAGEEDLNRFGWPLPDDTLAEVIERLAAAGPRAIGIDLYRDRPRPPGTEALDAALTRHTMVVVVHKAPAGAFDPGIPAPPVLQGTDQTGFADVVIDPDGVVRRGLLILDTGAGPQVSLPFNLAVRFLAADALFMAPDPDQPDAMRLGRGALPPLGSRFGGYAGVDAGGYQVLLDFRAGREALPRVSLSDLLDGAIPMEPFQDRVVLVGISADSVKDSFLTPLDRSMGGASFTAGIAVHGHLVDQLIRLGRGDTPAVRSLSPGSAALLTWGWAMLGALGGLLAVGWSWMLALALGAILAVLGLGAAALWSFWWLPMAAPLAATLLALSLVTAWRMQREKADRESLMRLFSVNVSPNVAEALWRERETFMDQGRPVSRDLTATVMFTDIRDFTTISESLSAPVLLTWLNRYMETMVAVISEHGGVVDKFVGDSIMAVFGVPIPRGGADGINQDAVRAVSCACALADTLESLNAGFAAEGLPQVGMRVGINTGPLVAGALGGHERMNYTVLGDTVNIASRLESFDKTLASDRPCRVLIGDDTAALVGPLFELKPVGEVSLKGKNRVVSVHLVDGRRTNPASIADGVAAVTSGDGPRV